MRIDKYHHGNLQEALLRQGLVVLREQGEDKLSLRELAKQCGVSMAAPYAHYENKEMFIRALQEAVMRELTEQLTDSAEEHAGKKDILVELGLRYVRFFMDNPNYFSLLFGQSEHTLTVLWQEESGSNPAFDVLKRAADPLLRELQLPDETKYNILLAMWALVHGLAAAVCVPDVSKRMREDPHANQRLRGILTAFSSPLT